MTTPMPPADSPAPPPPAAASPFHPGEQAVQARAGVRERAERLGQRMIRDAMPDQHRDFYRQLPMLVAGSVDGEGRPWASLLVGRPGFAGSPDPRTLIVGARPAADDPLAAGLAVGAPVGLLGIQLETRRRNRVNGTVAGVGPLGFTLRVDQSFGNCPQYIQVRVPEFRRDPRQHVPGPALRADALSAEAAALVARADTFFIATTAGGADAATGVDVSHRGGRPGFVAVSREGGRTVLTFPDFAGNAQFNTLGNVAATGRAGLLFVDFAGGATLQVTGAAAIVWEGPALAAFAGAERLVRVEVEATLLRADAVPLRWSAPEFAPQLAATGTWPEAGAQVSPAIRNAAM